MVKKRGSDDGKAIPPSSDLLARAQALAKEAKSLLDSTSRIAGQMPQQTGQQVAPGESDRDSSEANVSPSVRNQQEAGSQDSLAQRYYAQLEQTGQLADVDEHTDISKLSPNITHIRHPNGYVERIGFS